MRYLALLALVVLLIFVGRLFNSDLDRWRRKRRYEAE